jgi:hypothetical protein
LFKSGGYRILRSSIKVDEEKNKFGASFSADANLPDAKVFELVEQIMKTGSVESIEFSPDSSHRL